MIKKYLILFFLLFHFLKAFPQATTLDWVRQKGHSWGQFFKKDFENNLIVCGKQSAEYRKIIIVKYDTLGNELWQKIYSDTAFFGDVTMPRAMELDDSGNVYITGVTNFNPLDTAPPTQVFLLKYSRNGNFLWKRNYGVNVGMVGAGTDLKIFNNRLISISGTFATQYFNSIPRAGVLSYDSAGNFRWAYLDTTICEPNIPKVEMDRAGNTYLIGNLGCSIQSFKIYISKFDSLGNFKWLHIVTDTVSTSGNLENSAIDDSSNIYVAGYGGINTASCLVAKIDSSGIQKWITFYNSSTNNNYFEYPEDIKINSNYEVFVCGQINPNGGPEKAFIFKLNSNGAISWSHFNLNRSWFTAMELYDSLNVITVGDSYVLSGYGIALTNFDENSGILKWSNQYQHNYGMFNLLRAGNSLFSSGFAVNDGSVYDDDSLTVIRFNVDILTGATLSNIQDGVMESIYPNPFSSEFIIIDRNNSQQRSGVRIYNVLGEKIFDKELIAPAKIAAEDWSVGIYILETQNETGLHRQKIIKQ